MEDIAPRYGHARVRRKVKIAENANFVKKFVRPRVFVRYFFHAGNCKRNGRKLRMENSICFLLPHRLPKVDDFRVR